MFYLIPRQYDFPKWQAPVTPLSHAFVFSDGTAVVNLYQLKQALTSLPDEVVYNHLGENHQDIANWVDHVVSDHELAELLRQQNHRWGAIVALERHLMRTLSLPAYLAKRWLAPVSLPFVFVSGEMANSLEQLLQQFNQVADSSINFHFERFPNDFCVWITENIGDYELADLLSSVNDRQHLINLLSDHLEMLKDAAEG